MYDAAIGLDPDLYHRLARATFAEMALAGITCVGEFHYLHHRADGGQYSDPNEMGNALLSAAAEAGIRITLLDTLYLHGGLDECGYRPAEGVQQRFSDGSFEPWAERVDLLTPAATQRIGAAIHSVRAVDPAAIASVAEWAQTTRAPLHAHVSEQPLENVQCRAFHGATPTQLLEDHGALTETFTAVHATHIDDDIERYARARPTVCLCPTTERDLGDGVGPSRPLSAEGVPISLGTDSHAVIDMFEEARAVELDERLRSRERGIHPAAALLEMATVNGHRSLGWHDAGAIEVGARADLVTVALDTVRTAGITHDSAIEGLVFAASATDVRHVIADGVTVVHDGEHRRIDVAGELRSAILELIEP
jgi:formiminoglutamate deiminase